MANSLSAESTLTSENRWLMIICPIFTALKRVLMPRRSCYPPSRVRYSCIQIPRCCPVLNTYTPVFSWRSTLSTNVFHSSPRQSVPSLHADLAFTLLTYSFLLSNLARSTVASLGNYELERTISDTERKAKDEKLNFAVTLLCRASGVYKYLSETVLPEWDKSESSSVGRPPDVTTQVTNALAKLVSINFLIILIGSDRQF